MPMPEKQKTNAQLKFGYWWISNRLLFKKILLWLFIVFDVFLVGLPAYFIVITSLEKPLVVDFPVVHQPNPPQMLEVLETNVLPSGANRYDLTAKIKNPNIAIAAASFDYRFKSGIFSGEFRRGFILPNEEKSLVELGVESKTAPDLAEIEIANIRWLRLGKIMPPGEYENFRENHLNFEIKNKIFTSAAELKIGEKIPISKSTFTIVNQTAYSYYEVGLIVGLYNYEKLVAINYIGLNNFLAGESRQVDLNWLQNLPRVTEIKVEPVVSILDEEAYISPI